MTCPHCQQDARCNGFRPRTLTSLLGTLAFRRHYYHCKHCHRGHFPLDGILGLQGHELTPAAEEVVCLQAVQVSYARCAERILPKASGLRVCESTVERAAQDAGKRLAEAFDTGPSLGSSPLWDWHKDAEGKTVAYVSVDATGVAMQGPNGAEAPGRMAYVGMIYNPVPQDPDRWAAPHGKHPTCQARYVSRLRPLSELSARLLCVSCQGGEVGMDRAERWIASSDGGSGLEDFLGDNFPRVEEVILDFFHVSEHLGELAQVYSCGEESAKKKLLGSWCHQLKHEGGEALLGTLRALDLGGKNGTAREKHREVVGYVENQKHRMDYPRYVKKGWQIGSGSVESGCKQVGERLKARKRWGEDGADSMCHLRALFLSESQQWEAFFSRN